MTITREQSLNMKGLGIFLIMIHNFVDHLLDISCNEMSFSQEATDAFTSHIFTSSALWYLFSFAGWIGVPLFFFLSGYGLTKKYGTNHIDIFQYIKQHVIKLWLLLIPVYLLYVIISHFCFGQAYYWKTQILSVITFTANIHNVYFIEPGVYWFFGVILQFYILFLIFRKLKDKWLYALIVLFIIINYISLYCMSDLSMLKIRHNFTGWGVPFLLGIIAARRDITIPKRWELPICVVSFLLVCLCMTYKPLIPFSELFFVVFSISLVKMCTLRPVAFLGVISASIFVVHPLIRMIMYKTICPPHGASSHPISMTIFYIAVVLLLSWAHHILMKKVSSRKKHGNQ